jgi:hypothetical protein
LIIFKIYVLDLDVTGNSEEEEEKQRLIERVLELQSTLEGLWSLKLRISKLIFFVVDLTKKVTDVKEENMKLKSENQILGNYIDNLMQASNVFQTTWQSNNKKS